MKTLLPEIKCAAIEINQKAAEILRNDRFFENDIEVIEKSIIEYSPNKIYDFVLIISRRTLVTLVVS